MFYIFFSFNWLLCLIYLINNGNLNKATEPFAPTISGQTLNNSYIDFFFIILSCIHRKKNQYNYSCLIIVLLKSKR